jgi:hypothetical protein
MPELDPAVQLRKLSANDGEWHLVHATGVAPVWRSRSEGRDTFLSLEKCKTVTSQGIHLHIYGTYFDRDYAGYAPYVELARTSRYFHIEDQLEFDDLLTAMTQYDYAWKHWNTSDIAIRPAFARHLTPNFHAYLQSGLPLLMSPAAPPLEVEMARQHGVGLFVGEEQIYNLRSFLDRNKQQLREMQDRVVEAKRTVFSYDTDALLSVVGPYLANRVPLQQQPLAT